MSKHSNQTALVTGSTSGLGFEAAAQLAQLGYGRVILTGRTQAKAEAARKELVQRVGSDPFEVIAVDMGKKETVDAAVSTLVERGSRIDLAILNAGLVAGSEVAFAEDGIELTIAASITGHHRLTLGLLANDLLTKDARIVTAGSEAARGDVPMMGLTDVPTFAKDHFDGDREKAIIAISRAEAPYAYSNMPHYAMTKLFLAWWTAALSRRLPTGITINAISPGSAPATGAMRNQPKILQLLMKYIMSPISGLIGMGAPPSVAAQRYFAPIDFGADKNGDFYASAPGKMTGAVEIQTQPHVLDIKSQEAAWHAIIELTGVGLPAAQLKEVV